MKIQTPHHSVHKIAPTTSKYKGKAVRVNAMKAYMEGLEVKFH